MTESSIYSMLRVTDPPTTSLQWTSKWTTLHPPAKKYLLQPLISPTMISSVQGCLNIGPLILFPTPHLHEPGHCPSTRLHRLIQNSALKERQISPFCIDHLNCKELLMGFWGQRLLLKFGTDHQSSKVQDGTGIIHDYVMFPGRQTNIRVLKRGFPFKSSGLVVRDNFGGAS